MTRIRIVGIEYGGDSWGSDKVKYISNELEAEDVSLVREALQNVTLDQKFGDLCFLCFEVPDNSPFFNLSKDLLNPYINILNERAVNEAKWDKELKLRKIKEFKEALRDNEVFHEIRKEVERLDKLEN